MRIVTEIVLRVIIKGVYCWWFVNTGQVWVSSAKRSKMYTQTLRNLPVHGPQMQKKGEPVKNMGGSIKLLHVIMFENLKSCQKCIFGPVKGEKFLQYLDTIAWSSVDPDLWCYMVWPAHNELIESGSLIFTENSLPVLIHSSCLLKNVLELITWNVPAIWSTYGRPHFLVQCPKVISSVSIKISSDVILDNPNENFSEVWMKIQLFSYNEINFKIMSAKLWPFCLSLNVLSNEQITLSIDYREKIMSSGGVAAHGNRRQEEYLIENGTVFCKLSWRQDKHELIRM